MSISDRQRLYNEANVEKRREWDRNAHNRRYKKTAEQQKKKSKRYYKQHKEKILLDRKKYRLTNMDKFDEYNRSDERKIVAERYHLTPEGRFSSYKSQAASRDIPFELTMEQFMTFWQKPCFYYSGHKIATIGLDRIDSSKGYTLDNVVPCCARCNRAKLDDEREAFFLLCNEIASEHPRKIRDQLAT